MIEAACSNCGSSCQFKDGDAGKTYKCPKCGARNTVPSAKPAPRYEVEILRAGRETLEYRCPKCLSRLETPVSMRGKPDTCPVCSSRIFIPDEMIKYRCPQCKADLTSPVSLGGQKDRCPVCGAPCDVPLTKAQRARQREREKARERSLKAEERIAAKAASDKSADRPAAPDKPRPRLPVAQPRAEGAEIYPWETPLEVFDRAEAYEQAGDVQAFECRCNEFLNIVSRNEALAQAAPTELRIYPDMVGAVGAPPGCLAILWGIVSFILMIALAPIGLLMSIPRYLIWLSLWPLRLLLELIARLYYDYIARRIRKDPLSSWAIRKLFQLTPVLPRFWHRGQIVQLVRVEARRFLCGRRSLLLLVQDRPIPRRPGCLEALLDGLIGRRRVYVVIFKHGQQQADAAAEAVGGAMGLAVVRAKFRRRGGLKMP